MKLKHIAIAAAAALTLAGCSTAAEQACLNNTPMAGYTIAETCTYAMAERANMNAEAAAALGAVAVGVGTYAAIEANRNQYRTQMYLVTPTGPFSTNYMITGPYGE